MLGSRSAAAAGILGLVLLLSGEGGRAAVQEQGVERAQALLKQGRAKEASEALLALASERPRDPDLQFLLGLASLRLRQPERARAHLERAIALAPEHVEARTLLGWIHLEVERDYDRAAEQYAAVAKLRPALPEAHNNLGVALRRRGELAAALESFDRALALRADYAEALSNRGWLHVERRDWARARADFEAALKLDPDHHGALYGMAQVHREARQYASAEHALRRLIARAPNFVYWLEWGEVQLIRYYWLLLVMAAGLFGRAQWRKFRRSADGR
jgi:protein arginine N-methyltransferase 7